MKGMLCGVEDDKSGRFGREAIYSIVLHIYKCYIDENMKNRFTRNEIPKYFGWVREMPMTLRRKHYVCCK